MSISFKAEAQPLLSMSLNEGLVDASIENGEGYKKARDKVFQKPSFRHDEKGSDFFFPLVTLYTNSAERLGLATSLDQSCRPNNIQ